MNSNQQTPAREWKTIKEFSDILFEFFEGIAKISINRPEVYNAFRPQTNAQILEALAYCRDTPEVRVVVLTGVGDKAFCSGGDQNYKPTAATATATAHRASTCSISTRLSARS